MPTIDQATDAELYEQYGRLGVQAEILQGQINTIKVEINRRINKPRPSPPTPNE